MRVKAFHKSGDAESPVRTPIVDENSVDSRPSIQMVDGFDLGANGGWRY